MCGFFGVISKPGRFRRNVVESALNSLEHRGPDHSQLEHHLIDERWELWFGHRRLSIIDTSSSGHQPMYMKEAQNEGLLTYNGEFYNYKDLRKDFEQSYEFRSQSDTEVLLIGLLREGPEFLKQVNGFFAFAQYDFKKKTLLLSRDRLGKKPIYVYQTPELIVFASELKAILKLSLPLTLDEESMSFYRWLGYVPATKSIYKECIKFPAGNYATLNLHSDRLPNLEYTQFWDPFASYGKRFSGTFHEAMEHLEYLLEDAVKIRVQADVPVGVFLSGGIDSSLVASYLATLNTGVSAYTVRFEDPDFDESQVAKNTASYLGLNIRELPLNESDFAKQRGKLSKHFDEPFSDSSQIPTMAISERARQFVTVVLTGDGGDEIFLGYPRFSIVDRLRTIRSLLHAIPFAKSSLSFLLNQSWTSSFIRMLALRNGVSAVNMHSKRQRLRNALNASDSKGVYESVMEIWPKESLQSEERKFIEQHSLWDWFRSWYPKYGWDYLESRSDKEKFAALDMISYMRDDVLTKVDRGTMAYSIEARSPLLDYRIVELGTSLPLEYKWKDGQPKYLLRELARKRLGDSLSQLPKRGFGVPLTGNLPPGPNPSAQWNLQVEKLWCAEYLSALNS